MQQPAESAKGAQRYRISFIAHFYTDIEASDADEARRMADHLQTLPTATLVLVNHPTSCAWNTIEPLE